MCSYYAQFRRLGPMCNVPLNFSSALVAATGVILLPFNKSKKICSYYAQFRRLGPMYNVPLNFSSALMAATGVILLPFNKGRQQTTSNYYCLPTINFLVKNGLLYYHEEGALHPAGHTMTPYDHSSAPVPYTPTRGTSRPKKSCGNGSPSQTPMKMDELEAAKL
ncbi:uncharacterized [Tachysurus ichikawai]